ncbi:MAG: tRNA preQ1(34) S-adenosylmethionine ribosyltransferase-isomerase QueA [Verrucomicrobiae bacterium]|nr:tRNA preQ1(34) S-adenosylmethionine ribosyltransferase-isomerase QueA [Verrucomicrobiae bacterium]
MRADDFDYPLPVERIAQHPPPLRTHARLLVVHRSTGTFDHSRIDRLPLHLQPGDLLVRNDSRVFPARLRGHKPDTHGRIEILLLEPVGPDAWRALLRPGKRVRPGTPLAFGTDHDPLHARVREKDPEGVCVLEFPPGTDVIAFAERHGEVPLPPYIHRDSPAPADRDRYQTVYARTPGSVAAPTAGLHFTPELLAELETAGVTHCDVTLHVGAGTFAPVKTDRIEDHVMHAERYRIGTEAAAAIETARREGRRVIAVGTTSLRVLETCARQHGGSIHPGEGVTRLFVHPPATFHVVEGLLTNFHLPRSTLLMLVAALAAPGSTTGRDLILRAYREAVEHQYRFFSYGDAMLLL